ncbi:MAG: flippase-like domain-containing protein [Jiangellaceae bacterium]|nr:flippase-like domain-containing protein [Jiangellaceae bacterium]
MEASATMADTGVDETRVPVREITVEEPPLPRRTRRPMDVLRLVITALGAVAIVGLAIVGERTATGLGEDLAELGERLPPGPVELLDLTASLVSVVLPPLVVVVLMVRGRLRATAELLIAGAIAAVIAAAVSTLLRDADPGLIGGAFQPVDKQAATETVEPVAPGVNGPAQLVPAYPALLVAVVTVTAWLNLRRVRHATIFAVTASIAVGLLEGVTTVPGALLSLGIGRTVGLGVRLASGRPSTAPDGRAVGVLLRTEGYDVHAVRAQRVDQHRRYVVETSTGPLGVLVLDRENEGAGLLAALIAQARTREEVLPHEELSLRGALDRAALLSLALSGAGARTPRLRQALNIGDDAAVLVFDHIPGRPLADVRPGEVTDAVLADLWQQVQHLHQSQVAHRRLSARTILVGDDGKVWLLNPSGGEIAAPDLALRVDLAQALVTVGLVVGPDRAVSTAITALGPEQVASALPVLQPIALARTTRRALRRNHALVRQLRDRIVARTKLEEPVPIRIERVRPLSLLTGLGAVLAVYLVGTQLAEAPVGTLLSQVQWGWVALALVSMAVNFVGAAYALLGFVPEHVPFWRTYGAQVCLGFVRLAAPAAVGTAAINLRLLSRAGIGGPPAAASVAANQAGNVAVSIPLIIVLGIVTGSSATFSLDPSPTTLAILAGAIVLAGVLLLMPPIRIRARAVWDDFTRRGLPRLLDVLGNPRKLTEAVGGTLLQAAALVFCFYACIRALGSDVNIAALAVVQLVGNTVGSAVPTPGGLGAVEAALTAGVTALGVGSGVGVSAVLLFRIVTFWLPILPGWILWTQMQKRGLL